MLLFNAATNLIDLHVLSSQKPMISSTNKRTFLLSQSEDDSFDRSSTEKCRPSPSCVIVQTVDAIIHEHSFSRIDSKKWDGFVQKKTLFFYWSGAIKIKILPTAFLLCSFFHMFEIDFLSGKQRPFSEFQHFYLFTIIGDNSVLCFYDGNKFRFFALYKRKKACTVENRRKIQKIAFFMHTFRISHCWSGIR